MNQFVWMALLATVGTWLVTAIVVFFKQISQHSNHQKDKFSSGADSEYLKNPAVLVYL
ncbi:MAG: hypothetical protein K2J71_08525 [Oscillospiraceae bacterium]|nr:hypothetical protein [Oscillospiraceae bacterium]